MSTLKLNRRTFLQTSASAAALLVVNPLRAMEAPKISLTETSINRKNMSNLRGVQIGTITYSYRDQSNRAGDLLLYALAGGVGSVELMADGAETFAGNPGEISPVG